MGHARSTQQGQPGGDTGQSSYRGLSSILGEICPQKSSPQGEKRRCWERIGASSGAKTPFCHRKSHLLPLRDKLKQRYPSQKEKQANEHGDAHPTIRSCCAHVKARAQLPTLLERSEIQKENRRGRGGTNKNPNKAVIGLVGNDICKLEDSCVTTKGPSLELSHPGGR